MQADEAGFTSWAGERQLALLRTAILLTGDRQRAEDLVQEALVAVASRWRRLAGGNPEAYARQVIVRGNVSWWRKHRREVVLDPRETPVASYAVGAERRLLLDDALARLTPRQRAVVVLRYYADLTERDTADALGCSVGTVKSQTHLALRRLREALPGLDGAGRPAGRPDMTSDDLRNPARRARRRRDRAGPRLRRLGCRAGAARDVVRPPSSAAGCAAVLVIAGGVALGDAGWQPRAEPGRPGDVVADDRNRRPPTRRRATWCHDEPYAEPGPATQGVETWWFGEPRTRPRLPRLDGSGLPRVIDLADGRAAGGRRRPGRGAAGRPARRAGVAGGRGDRRRSSRSVDIDRLDPVRDEGTNLLSPVVSESLAPDGSRAFFVQERSLEVYDFDSVTGRVSTPRRSSPKGRGGSPRPRSGCPSGSARPAQGTSYDLRDGSRSTAFVRFLGDPEWPGARGQRPGRRDVDRPGPGGLPVRERDRPGRDVVRRARRGRRGRRGHTELLVLGAHGRPVEGLLPGRRLGRRHRALRVPLGRRARAGLGRRHRAGAPGLRDRGLDAG